MKAHAVLLVSVLVAGGAALNAPPPPVIPEPATYEGTWTDQTEQAQSPTFSVTGNHIKALGFKSVYAR
jgi:hypothetical protein